jgi:hypothetical protein
MESIVGIFRSAENAQRAAEALARTGIPRERLSVLTPRSPEAEVHTRVATSETEQPGMGKAVGGVVGGVFGATAGMGLGALAASLLVPGFGAVAAAELLGGALLGAGGVAGGAAAGGALEEKLSRGLPKDELYLYEHALRSGHSVVFALVPEDHADRARAQLAAEGAESLDAARESWWVGIRDTERADYERDGGDFAAAEPAYRRGFEAAMRPRFRDRSYDAASSDLRGLYPEYFGLDDFQRGYERGRAHRKSSGPSRESRAAAEKHHVG